jgi:hypothetical protein
MKEIPPRILNEAKLQAQRIATSIANRYAISKIKSWDDIKSQYSIDIPADYTTKPWNYASVADVRNPDSFAYYWLHGYELRLLASMSRENPVAADIKPVADVETYGEFTLKPDQQGVLNYSYDWLFGAKDMPAILDMSYAGAGKGTTTACLIAKLYQQGHFTKPENSATLYQVIILCPRNVAEHWRRELEKAGIGDKVADQSILVFPFSDFSASHSTVYVDEEEDYTTGECKLKWKDMFAAPLVVIDELHNFCNKNTYRTKAVLALAQTRQKKKFIALSATPGEKINDMYLYTLLAQPTFQGVKIKSEAEFKYMARILDAHPEKPNVEAMKRYRLAMESYMISVPYVKPKYKAHVRIQLCEFENDKAREVYQTAIDRYIAACEKAGRNTAWGRWQRGVELGILNRTVEPLRVPWMAARAAESYKRGDIATLMASSYLETISEFVYTLVSKYNIPREKISVIWGGKEPFKPKDLLNQDQLQSILKGDMDKINKLFETDPRLGKKVLATLNYLHDQVEHNETAQAQAQRHEMLRILKLTGTQSLNNRQIEIDKFQSGETVINAFTVYCGREGLSFDRSKPHLLPREGLFSPNYDGKKFKQLLGRPVRRESLSDADILICMMKGTTEEYHIAPILDNKLKCISAITNRFIDVVDLIQKDKPEVVTKLRDAVEAAQDAEKEAVAISDITLETEEEDEENDLDSILV